MNSMIEVREMYWVLGIVMTGRAMDGRRGLGSRGSGAKPLFGSRSLVKTGEADDRDLEDTRRW